MARRKSVRALLHKVNLRSMTRRLIAGEKRHAKAQLKHWRELPKLADRFMRAFLRLPEKTQEIILIRWELETLNSLHRSSMIPWNELTKRCAELDARWTAARSARAHRGRAR